MRQKRFFRRKSAFLAVTFSVFVFASVSFAQEAERASPSEVIKKYREVLEEEKDPARIAQAHYEIGYALEKLGRRTEATAEYLKIIVNHPDVAEYNKKAEERLGGLYASFRKKSRELTSRYEITEEEKDPTIFFAYIKSLYENYRNLGQYELALNVLRQLYDMDPENPSYLLDMGEVYLHGYNDADKAIFHFTEAARISPEDPKVYAELGRAYEKKEDYESAIRAYSRARDIAPASPWAIYGLRRIDGIRLATDKRLVKDWYFLGPFDNSARDGLERVFPPEQKINLNATYVGKGDKKIKWFRPFDYDASGYVDLNMLFTPNDYSVSYALTYVYSPTERMAQLRFGAEDGIKIWLNDKVIASYDVAKSEAVDSEIVKVPLKKGWNRILMKVTDTWGSWGFYFRITDVKGAPFGDLIFDPFKNNERMKRIYRKILIEKRTRITRIAVMYAAALSALLLGLYFMISNIYFKIKIRRMKEDFISSVSHELKTPISAVRMLAETLKRGKVKQEARRAEYYDMMIREADRLTRFINKILDFSKLEKGGKIFHFERDNVVAVAKNAVDVYRDEAQDSSLKLAFNADREELPAEIDRDAILQVVFNLIDNAYKYSRGEKEITVNVKEMGKGVAIEVIDKGLGIPKKDIERIFDKFYRADRDMVKGIKGSGLGLAFVKSVIEEHGGKIAVESEVGKGTKFIIWLPGAKI